MSINYLFTCIYICLYFIRVDRCTESYKGKPFCCKLIPDNPSERTYVVAVAAEHELDVRLHVHVHLYSRYEIIGIRICVNEN